ncbi:hypothetical protein CFAM422_013367 [Trichoderma lentiforme]|uniref:Uncharacterized protein n=1 Tax=Trichoderma lentiforme TaxID=1567552 RepID=A0A9P4X2Y8_9HYPO|nr:hypothetical protein CFAM422_013367 [Trichoderma lentiforme]
MSLLRTLSSAILLALVASGKQIILNFDDIAVSNDHGCANSTLIDTAPYHGIAIPGLVLNATKTPACSSLLDEEMSVALFGRATSPTNVLFSQGTLDAQIIFDISVKFEALINEASFDILPVFTNTELNSSNVTVIVNTLQSDFGNVNVENQFQFHTGTDGLGPYHISVSSNGAEYQFLEISVTIPSGNTSLPGQSRSSAFFVDSLVLENID